MTTCAHLRRFLLFFTFMLYLPFSSFANDLHLLLAEGADPNEAPPVLVQMEGPVLSGEMVFIQYSDTNAQVVRTTLEINDPTTGSFSKTTMSNQGKIDRTYFGEMAQLPPKLQQQLPLLKEDTEFLIEDEDEDITLMAKVQKLEKKQIEMRRAHFKYLFTKETKEDSRFITPEEPKKIPTKSLKIGPYTLHIIPLKENNHELLGKRIYLKKDEEEPFTVKYVATEKIEEETLVIIESSKGILQITSLSKIREEIPSK